MISTANVFSSYSVCISVGSFGVFILLKGLTSMDFVGKHQTFYTVTELIVYTNIHYTWWCKLC